MDSKYDGVGKVLGGGLLMAGGSGLVWVLVPILQHDLIALGALAVGGIATGLALMRR